MAKKTCFIISPIGDDGTDIRRHADDFLELLVEPALALFDFNVIRADKIARASIITNDIVEFVQQSDLCLVDLTFHNPNVFYECGRRHETGRPTIQLIKKGEKLPFDVAGVRTIEYDLSDPRTTLESVKNVQKFIGELDSTGSYGAQSSGVSLTTVAEALSRIERTLSSRVVTSNTPSGSSLTRKDLITMHPGQAFHKAIEQGDIESARFVLQRIRQYMGESSYVYALAVLAEAADESSKNELYALFPKLIENRSYQEIKIGIAGVKDFYTTTASFAKGIIELQDIVYLFTRDSDHPNDVRAFILNILQMLRYQEDQFSDALIDALKVVELAPEDNSYHYNLSLIYKKLEKYSEAADSALKYMAFADKHEPHHLKHVEDVMIRAGRGNELEALFSKIPRSEFATFS
jgi:hypothetical protein